LFSLPAKPDKCPDSAEVAATSHEGLPPAVVVTAGLDVLHDEGAEYAMLLRAAKVPVARRNYPEMFHGVMTIMPFEAGASARDLLWADIRRLLAPV
jgi:acetyl esterase